MRLFRLIALYTALAMGANATFAGPGDFGHLNDVKSGDMKKMVLSGSPAALPTTTFLDETGAEKTFADFKGKATLVNLWATWCPPCRKEMPSLAQLQKQLGSEDFQVVTLATMRNTAPAIDEFFASIGADNLTKYNDPKGQVARDLGIFGLPTTLLIDANGNEIARLAGDADWASPDAITFLSAFIEAAKN